MILISAGSSSLLLMKSQPIRVAILCYRDDAISGGSLRVAEVLAKHLDPARVAVHLVFAYGGPGPVSRNASVPCHYLEGKSPGDIRAWLRARRLLRSIKPDIVHYMDNIVWLQGALLGSGYKKVVHVHGPLLEPDLSCSLRVISWLTLRPAHRVLCISQAARDNLLSLGLVRPENVSVVYNSINCAQFDHSFGRNEARNQLGLPPDALLAGMVCRLVPNKGCADFLSLIQRLPSRWQGVLCGEGPERAELESRCRELNITSRVHFLGLQDDVRPVYAALDAYAFFTRYESFGLMLAEAMAAAVPIFGFSGHGGYSEPQYPLITTESAALMEYDRPLASDDPASNDVLEELARVIIDYGNDPQAYAPMIERARCRVRACFDAPIQAEAVSWIYETICKSETSADRSLTSIYDQAIGDAKVQQSMIQEHSPGAMIEVA
jgi:glycosyltransferase involved in cell wall biosynthesis